MLWWTFLSSHLLPAAIIILLTVLVAYIVRKIFNRILKSKGWELHNSRTTTYLFLRHLSVGMVYLIGIGWALWTIPGFQSIAGSLVTGAGILAVIAGLASQTALSNLVSGIFIIIFKPFHIGDRISFKGYPGGIVEDITLRHTVIRDYNNTRYVVPNSIISNDVVTNNDLHDSKICKWIEVGIAYSADLLKAKRVIQEVVMANPLRIDVRTAEQIKNGTPEVPVKVIRLDDSAVVLRAWAWAVDAGQAFDMNCQLLEEIKLKLDEEGIEIPYPYRSVVMKQEGTPL